MFSVALRRDWEDIVKDEEKLLPLEPFWDGSAAAQAGVTDHEVALRFISFAMERDLYYDFAVAFVQKEIKKNGGNHQVIRLTCRFNTTISRGINIGDAVIHSLVQERWNAIPRRVDFANGSRHSR
eukprot:TRINITY_DN408_c0_g1_i7.p1 TRINITY_DN408_c0_g1~~TRINITY_DN408_c0_g1_i7.p1  ORF type:complete len:140 (+),score=4.44 TRINITY_DN408_c0_g1_i7:46-420(+)